jgi:ribosomal protein S6
LKAYEALFIFDAAVSKETLDALIRDVESDITKTPGTIAEIQRIGKRRLEHPIKKKPEGYYVQVNFHGEPVEKLRLKESILRFFIVDREEGFVKFKVSEEGAFRSEGFGGGGSRYDRGD